MSTGTSNPKEVILAELRGEDERIKRRIMEMQSMIDQSQAEVKRLTQRNVDATARLSQLDANFDTVPRNEIKVTYTNVIEARQRLMNMQGQLEKFQNDRAQLEQFGKLFEKLLGMLEGVPASQFSSAISTEMPIGGASGSLNDETIVRIVNSQESERQRLARQMHDGPAQSLTNFILQAEICRRLFDRNPDRAAEELDNLKTAASTTFQKVRDFIFDLRPMMLDDLGLAPTMRRYMEAFTDKSGLKTQINIVGEERRRVEEHTEITMFRGLQELLGYIREYTGATRVDLVLDVTSSPIKATVSFDGKTIEEIEASSEQNKGKIFGLDSLRDRIELVGGVLDTSSSDGEGTRVEIAIPAVDAS